MSMSSTEPSIPGTGAVKRRKPRRHSTMTGSRGEATPGTRRDGRAQVSRTFSSDDMSGLPTPSQKPRPSSSNSAPNSSAQATSESIQVCVRVRPIMFHEQGSTQCVQVVKDVYTDHPCVVELGGGPQQQQQSTTCFTFDEAFSVSTTQKQIFTRRVTPLIDRCLDGYNATILAYGQTGAGKTHTMMGPEMEMSEEAGIIPRAVTKIFDDLGEREFEIRVQFLEVYGEDIRDLLAPSKGKPEKLTIRDVNDDPEVLGATQHQVSSASEALSTLSRGMLQRVTASTAMNESSSRSHAIMTLLVDQTVTASSKESDSTHKRSKFNFVDLAGAERQKRTKATGQRLKEGVDINKGLLVLGNVISALGDPKKRKSFVPYRDSKLTRLLKGSLGGNHKSLMIACVSPADKNMAESINCLRYANRAKNIKNRAVQNVDGSSQLQDLRQQVQDLARDLMKATDGKPTSNFSLQMLQVMAQFSDQEMDAIKKASLQTSNCSCKRENSECLPTPEANSMEDHSTKNRSNSTVNQACQTEPYLTKPPDESKHDNQDDALVEAISNMDSQPTTVNSSGSNATEAVKMLEGSSNTDGSATFPDSNDGMDTIAMYEEELSLLRQKLKQKDDQQEIVMGQTLGYVEEIKQLRQELKECQEERKETSIIDILPPTSEDDTTDKQEILSARTDVCGCVFLTVSGTDGVKLIKDTNVCKKGHGGGNAPIPGDKAGTPITTTADAPQTLDNSTGTATAVAASAVSSANQWFQRRWRKNAVASLDESTSDEKYMQAFAEEEDDSIARS